MPEGNSLLVTSVAVMIGGIFVRHVPTHAEHPGVGNLAPRVGGSARCGNLRTFVKDRLGPADPRRAAEAGP